MGSSQSAESAYKEDEISNNNFEKSQDNIMKTLMEFENVVNNSIQFDIARIKAEVESAKMEYERYRNTKDEQEREMGRIGQEIEVKRKLHDMNMKKYKEDLANYESIKSELSRIRFQIDSANVELSNTLHKIQVNKMLHNTQKMTHEKDKEEHERLKGAIMITAAKVKSAEMEYELHKKKNLEAKEKQELELRVIKQQFESTKLHQNMVAKKFEGERRTHEVNVAALKTESAAIIGEVNKMRLALQSEEKKMQVAKDRLNELNKAIVEKEISMQKRLETTEITRQNSESIVEFFMKQDPSSYKTNAKDYLAVCHANSKEYQYAKRTFMKTTQNHFQVVSVWRIVNHYMISNYNLRKREYELLHGKRNVAELVLFRGIKFDQLKGICRNNFSMRHHANYNLESSLKGLAFTDVSNYANKDCDNSAEKYMIMAKVLHCIENERAVTEHGFYDREYERNFDRKRRENHLYIKYRSDEFYPRFVIKFTGNTVQNVARQSIKKEKDFSQ